MADEISTAVSSDVSTVVTISGEAKWFDGFDEPTKAYISSRGLSDKDISDAFRETAKAHQEAQAYIGVPKEQLLKLPKEDAPPEEWDAVYERFGYSKNADDYKLEGLKYSDGTDVDDGFKDFVRQQASELHLSPAATAKLAEAVIKHNESGTAARTADETAAATKSLEQLRQSWGPNYEANKVIADNAYAAMMKSAGFSQEQMTAAIQKLGETAGRAEAMQMLLAVGQQLGEDKFVGGGGPSGGLTPRTAEGAKARIEELKKDSTFVQRWLGGGVNETKEMAKKIRVGLTIAHANDVPSVLWSNGIYQNIVYLALLMQKLKDVEVNLVCYPFGEQAIHPIGSCFKIPTINALEDALKLDVIIELGIRLERDFTEPYRNGGGKLVSYMAGNALVMNFEVADYAHQKKPDQIRRMMLFCTEHLKGRPHFESYIAKSTLGKASKVTAEGRHGIVAMLGREVDAVITHQWENDLNYLYWDVMWLGYPLIHNSSRIKQAGYYYPDFDPASGGKALLDALAHHKGARECDKEAIWTYHVGNLVNQRRYKELLNKLLDNEKAGVVVSKSQTTGAHRKAA